VATGGAGFFRTLGEVFLPGFDDLGILDVFFAFELGFEEAQEVVDDAHGDGLDALAGFAGGPGFAFVEFLFLLVEGFFDVSPQAAALVEGAGGEGHLVGQGDGNLVAVGAALIVAGQGWPGRSRAAWRSWGRGCLSRR
jgi:hypothetical protein